MTDTIGTLVKEYVDLRDQISELESKKKKLSERLKAGLTMLDTTVVKVDIDDKHWQIKLAKRSSRSCNYEGLKALHPDVYTQFVSTTESEYIDVRATKNGD